MALLPWLRKFLTLLNFLFSDIDHLIFVNIFNMHICFSVSRKLALKIMLKVNLRQCDGFVFQSNIFFLYCTIFLFFHTWKTNVCHFDIESRAHIYLF